jgi:hypothetical protein
VTWGSATSLNTNGDVPVRATGRLHRARISIPASSSWSHLSGIEMVEAKEMGSR